MVLFWILLSVGSLCLSASVMHYRAYRAFSISDTEAGDKEKNASFLFLAIGFFCFIALAADRWLIS